MVFCMLYHVLVEYLLVVFRRYRKCCIPSSLRNTSRDAGSWLYPVADERFDVVSRRWCDFRLFIPSLGEASRGCELCCSPSMARLSTELLFIRGSMVTPVLRSPFIIRCGLRCSSQIVFARSGIVRLCQFSGQLVSSGPEVVLGLFTRMCFLYVVSSPCHHLAGGISSVSTISVASFH